MTEKVLATTGSELVRGTVIGGYRVEGVIGEGGMGVVYRAVQLSLRRPVALKVLTTQLAFDEEARQRFIQEGVLAARVSHPHLVRVLQVGEIAHRLFLAYELVQGGTLRQRIRERGETSLELALEVATGCADALVTLHAAGILHRDIKPENIFLSKDRGPLVGDLGIAKDLGKGSVSTQYGQILGTPYYMAPELAGGSRASSASDLYALAVVFYECLAGRPPFVAADPLGTLKMHEKEPVPSLARRRPGLPSGVDAFVQRALAKKPDERYPDAASMLKALRQIEFSTSNAGRPTTRVPSTREPVVAADAEPRTVLRSSAGTSERKPGARDRRWVVPMAFLAAGLAGAGLALRFLSPPDRASPFPLSGPRPDASAPQAVPDAQAGPGAAPSAGELREQAERSLLEMTRSLASIRRATARAQRTHLAAPLAHTSDEIVGNLFSLWAQALPPLERALQDQAHLHRQGDPEAAYRAGRLLVELFMLSEFSKVQVWDILTAQARALDPGWHLTSFFSLGAVSSLLLSRVSVEALALQKRLPPEFDESPAHLWHTGVLCVRALSRFSIEGQELNRLARYAAHRADRIVPRLTLTPPNEESLLLLTASLRSLDFLGNTKDQVRLSAPHLETLSGSRLGPLEELARYELHRVKARHGLYTNIADTDEFARLDEQLEAYVELRDRLIRNWPSDLRQAEPGSGGDSDAERLDDEAVMRLNEARALVSVASRRLDKEPPPEPPPGGPMSAGEGER